MQKLKGIVLWMDNKKGYGFIKPVDGTKDLFVHYSNLLMEGFKQLEADQQVEYEIGENHKGPQAVNVSVLE